jgi:hypothetical protein
MEPMEVVELAHFRAKGAAAKEEQPVWYRSLRQSLYFFTSKASKVGT